MIWQPLVEALYERGGTVSQEDLKGMPLVFDYAPGSLEMLDSESG